MRMQSAELLLQARPALTRLSIGYYACITNSVQLLTNSVQLARATTSTASTCASALARARCAKSHVVLSVILFVSCFYSVTDPHAYVLLIVI